MQYLLRDQYAEIADEETRDAVLEAITSQLINDVFGGDLPGPRALAATLGPAMAQGRMVVWSRHPEDQPLLQRLEIAGDLPAPAGTASPSSAPTPAPTSSTPTSGAASATTRWSTRRPGGSRLP